MFGFCIQDLFALIALIAISAILIVQQQRHKVKVEKILKSKSTDK